VSELVPKEQRGPAFAYNQFVMFTAVPAVACRSVYRTLSLIADQPASPWGRPELF